MSLQQTRPGPRALCVAQAGVLQPAPAPSATWHKQLCCRHVMWLGPGVNGSGCLYNLDDDPCAPRHMPPHRLRTMSEYGGHHSACWIVPRGPTHPIATSQQTAIREPMNLESMPAAWEGVVPHHQDMSSPRSPPVAATSTATSLATTRSARSRRRCEHPEGAQQKTRDPEESLALPSSLPDGDRTPKLS